MPVLLPEGIAYSGGSVQAVVAQGSGATFFHAFSAFLSLFSCSIEAKQLLNPIYII
jgi:hypothetical protein